MISSVSQDKNKKRFEFRTAFFVGVFLALIAACSPPSGAERRFDGLPESLRAGGLVLRNGKGWISDGIRALADKELRFTHCGVLRGDAEAWAVDHMEETAEGEDLRRSTLGEYWDEKVAWGGAILRLSMTEGKLRQFLGRIDGWRSEGIGFDVGDRASDVLFGADLPGPSGSWHWDGTVPPARTGSRFTRRFPFDPRSAVAVPMGEQS